MYNLVRLGYVALVASALSGITSCSKDQSVNPASEVAPVSSEVKVVDGRMVFANVSSFQKVLSSLSTKDGKALDEWEQQLGFKSLRSSFSFPNAVNLENETAPNLLMEFGFPGHYATLINAEGEYQIADKLFWFHDGFKYEASSLKELKQIKSNPTNATLKTRAGKQTAASQSEDQSRTIRTVNNTNGDGKYPYEFPLNYDNNSMRRLNFESYIYSEDVTSSVPPPSGWAQTIYSAVVFNEYHEYYSRGSKRWYRSGDNRTSSMNVHVRGGLSGPDFAPSYVPSPMSFESAIGTAGGGERDIVISDYVHGGSDYQLSFIDTYMYKRYYPQVDPRYANLTWDFEVTGGISARVTNEVVPAFNPYHVHSRTGLLW